MHRGKELGNEKNHCNGTEEYYIRTILLDHMLNWYAAHVDNYTEEQRYAMLKKIDHAANRGGNLHIDGHGHKEIYLRKMDLCFIRITRDYMPCSP